MFLSLRDRSHVMPLLRKGAVSEEQTSPTKDYSWNYCNARGGGVQETQEILT